jgi:hypothetical protein
MLQRSVIEEEVVTDFHHNRNTSYVFFSGSYDLLIRLRSCKIELIRAPFTFIAILRLPSTGKNVDSSYLMM